MYFALQHKSRSVIWIKYFVNRHMTALRLLSFSSHIFSIHGLKLKLYSWPSYNTQTVPVPQMLTFMPHTLRCAHRNAGPLCPHASQRNQARHSGVNDAVALHFHPCSFPHNTQTPFLSLLFDVETACTFPVNLRDFWGGPNPAWLRWDSLALSPAVKSCLDRKIEAKCESSLAVEKRSEREAGKPEIWFRPVKDK